MDRDASVFRRPWLAFLAVALAAPPAAAVERLGDAAARLLAPYAGR